VSFCESHERVANKVTVICYLVFTITLNYWPGTGVTTGRVPETLAPTCCLLSINPFLSSFTGQGFSPHCQGLAMKSAAMQEKRVN